ncbi:MAG: CDP-diacylglycerol--glycerol-3-phosphate 3-phosphatidyltransferase [Mycoplasma sp.]|nr:CDP-diacylglycerol--glycerol-3-phosphate 3-phosphatidyltransferase [Mycoplasma sp.]
MNLPNKLTLLRVILIIPLIIVFSLFIWYVKVYENGNFSQVDINSKSQFFLYANGILFTLSMITDFLDGYLARKNNQITTFGKLFDPIADKILTTTTLIFLAIFNYTYVLVVILFVIRDLFVDGSRNLIAKHNMKVEANIFGKLKTIFQTIAILSLLFLIPVIDKNVWWQVMILNIPMMIALIMSIYSGIIYFKQVIPLLNSK